MDKLVNILIIENKPEDAELIKNAFEGVETPTKIYIVEDGETAVDFVYKKGKYENAPHPDLIILGLNLPKKHGKEILRTIKTDENLRIIPIIVLTESGTPEDVSDAYKNYANCFITKPKNFKQFFEMAILIEEFWLDIAKLPECQEI